MDCFDFCILELAYWLVHPGGQGWLAFVQLVVIGKFVLFVAVLWVAASLQWFGSNNANSFCDCFLGRCSLVVEVGCCFCPVCSDTCKFVVLLQLCGWQLPCTVSHAGCLLFAQFVMILVSFIRCSCVGGGFSCWCLLLLILKMSSGWLWFDCDLEVSSGLHRFDCGFGWTHG